MSAWRWVKSASSHFFFFFYHFLFAFVFLTMVLLFLHSVPPLFRNINWRRRTPAATNPVRIAKRCISHIYKSNLCDSSFNGQRKPSPGVTVPYDSPKFVGKQMSVACFSQFIFPFLMTLSYYLSTSVRIHFSIVAVLLKPQKDSWK